MTKATHNGTCQVCGRVQARGLRGVAKHGYKVLDWGFAGTCRGSDEDPVELSTILLNETVASLSRRAAELEALTLETLPPITMARRDPTSSAWNRKPNLMTVVHNAAEFEAWKVEAGSTVRGWTWKNTQDGELRRLHGVARSMRGHVAFLGELKQSRSGKPLHPRG